MYSLQPSPFKWNRFLVCWDLSLCGINHLLSCGEQCTLRSTPTAIPSHQLPAPKYTRVYNITPNATRTHTCRLKISELVINLTAHCRPSTRGPEPGPGPPRRQLDQTHLATAVIRGPGPPRPGPPTGGLGPSGIHCTVTPRVKLGYLTRIRHQDKKIV
jgi:hypothetical protein